MNKLASWISDKTLGNIPVPTFSRTRHAYERACSIRIPNWLGRMLDVNPLTAATSAAVLSIISLITFGLSTAQASTAALPHKAAPATVKAVTTSSHGSSYTPDKPPQEEVTHYVHVGGKGGLPSGKAVEPLRLKALHWARTQRGKPYIWGGPTMPGTSGGFDCSGIVQWAYQHAGGAGKRLGRDTYDMLSQVGLVLKQVWHPKPGDLAFFGTGHVELWLGRVMNRHWGHGYWYVYGAEEPGTTLHADRIFPGTSWWPTAFYEVV